MPAVHRAPGERRFFAPYELVPEKEEANRRMAVMLREAGIPVVLLDRDLTPFPSRSDFDVVGIDNIAGGHLLGEHLLKLGCRRIHFTRRSPDEIGRAAIGSPRNQCSSSSASASAEPYRRCGSFSKHFRAIVSRSRSTSGRSTCGGCGSLSVTIRKV